MPGLRRSHPIDSMSVQSRLDDTNVSYREGGARTQSRAAAWSMPSLPAPLEGSPGARSSGGWSGPRCLLSHALVPRKGGRMRLRHMSRALAAAAVFAVVAVACGGGGGTSSTPTAGGTTQPAPSALPTGGEIVLGAEQWPECINPITSCSSATWAYYSVFEQVLPYAMILDLSGNFVASPVLTEAPTLDNGGLTQNPFTVTYKIADNAVWADGTPMTSEDFDFSLKAIMNTTGTYTTAGYSSIDSIDTSDPKTAVMKFKEVFVDWPDLFGGVYGGFFEKAAFPQFADDPKPDLKDEMQDSIPFSGGPWILDSWSKDQAVFVRNDKWFGTADSAREGVPLLDKVTIVPRTDPAP